MESKLNIGCGYDKKKGFLNIDLSPEVCPDKVVDIEKGLPFKDETFEEIYSSHCLEHVRPEYWKFVLEEILRVSKNGCKIILDLPFDNIWDRTNADHYRTFSFTSFAQYTTKTNRPYYLKGALLKDDTKYPPRMIRMFHLFFPFFKRNIRFNFKVVKKLSQGINKRT